MDPGDAPTRSVRTAGSPPAATRRRQTPEYRAAPPRFRPHLEHIRFTDAGKAYQNRTFWVKVTLQPRPHMRVYVKQRPTGFCKNHPMGSIDEVNLMEQMPNQTPFSPCPEKLDLQPVQRNRYINPLINSFATFPSQSDADAALNRLRTRRS